MKKERNNKSSYQRLSNRKIEGVGLPNHFVNKKEAVFNHNDAYPATMTIPN
tara:strand:- start:2583 stop:2735 length:153 start_codon:yes stop_codon:yes gene_type:complete